MWLADVALPPSLLIAAVVPSLLLIGALLYRALATRSRLRQLERELADTRRELEEQSQALAASQREIARLERIPKAQLLPMLQLAHEMRTPLAAVRNAIETLLEGFAANDIELQREMLSLANDRAAAMTDRVNDFLRLGAIRHSELERKAHPVQLLDVVRRLVPEMHVKARRRGVELQLDAPESLPPIVATHEDMEHLFSNLLNNAIKYTQPGGKVAVSLREEAGSIVSVVKDTGIGISSEDLPKVFDEFYRSESAKKMDAHGTGLGLSIVKRVVELYGGHLDVESEIGRGTKFTLSFSAVEGTAEDE